jgi:predicted methyltransferase
MAASIPLSARARSAGLATSVVLLVLAGCAGPRPGAEAPPLGAERIAAIVASPDRSAADRSNDQRRKPAEMLAFIALRAGSVALDVSAGGGYTSELLARAIGPGGTVYGQSQPRDPNRAGPASPEGGNGSNSAAPPVSRPGPRTSAQALAERSARMRATGVESATLVAVERRFEDPAPPEVADGGVDLVTLMFNYHDLGHLGVDRAQMNRSLFRALRPGGHYVIADHAGRPGTGISESGTLHRVEESFLRREVEAAGFRLEAEGTFLRNPADPRDRNTPEPPQPKDEFVLKFVKP